jgi:hypothetical protein
MNTELRNTELGRTLYNQLRLSLSFPGEVVATIRKPYTPVNHDDWTWDDAMNAPDTPYITRSRATRETSMWIEIGLAS